MNMNVEGLKTVEIVETQDIFPMTKICISSSTELQEEVTHSNFFKFLFIQGDTEVSFRIIATSTIL